MAFDSDEPLPAVVVLDSSFIFEALVDPGTERNRHAQARAFTDRLLLTRTAVVVSPLLFIEAPQCWRRLDRRGALRHPEHEDNRASRVSAFMEATGRLRAYLRRFEAFEVPFTSTVSDEATRIVAEYNLNAHDALIVALTFQLGLEDLVALDRDVRRVDGLTLWQP